jgi:hypothetical protein
MSPKIENVGLRLILNNGLLCAIRKCLSDAFTVLIMFPSRENITNESLIKAYAIKMKV